MWKSVLSDTSCPTRWPSGKCLPLSQLSLSLETKISFETYLGCRGTKLLGLILWIPCGWTELYTFPTCQYTHFTFCPVRHELSGVILKSKKEVHSFNCLLFKVGLYHSPLTSSNLLIITQNNFYGGKKPVNVLSDTWNDPLCIISVQVWEDRCTSVSKLSYPPSFSYL